MSDETLTLNVKAGNAEAIQFKVKKTTTFKKIFQAYADRVGAAYNSFRFMYDGVRVNEMDTPKMLEIEDFDQIDVQIEQLGGTEGAGHTSAGFKLTPRSL